MSYFNFEGSEIINITQKAMAIDQAIVSQNQTLFGKIIEKLSQLSAAINKLDPRKDSNYYVYVDKINSSVNKAIQALDPSKDQERLTKIKDISSLEDNLAIFGILILFGSLFTLIYWKKSNSDL